MSDAQLSKRSEDRTGHRRVKNYLGAETTHVPLRRDTHYVTVATVNTSFNKHGAIETLPTTAEESAAITIAVEV